MWNFRRHPPCGFTQHKRVQVADGAVCPSMLGIIVIAHECTYPLRTCRSLSFARLSATSLHTHHDGHKTYDSSSSYDWMIRFTMASRYPIVLPIVALPTATVEKDPASIVTNMLFWITGKRLFRFSSFTNFVSSKCLSRLGMSSIFTVGMGWNV